VVDRPFETRGLFEATDEIGERHCDRDVSVGDRPQHTGASIVDDPISAEIGCQIRPHKEFLRQIEKRTDDVDRSILTRKHHVRFCIYFLLKVVAIPFGCYALFRPEHESQRFKEKVWLCDKPHIVQAVFIAYICLKQTRHPCLHRYKHMFGSFGNMMFRPEWKRIVCKEDCFCNCFHNHQRCYHGTDTEGYGPRHFLVGNLLRVTCNRLIFCMRDWFRFELHYLQVDSTLLRQLRRQQILQLLSKQLEQVVSFFILPTFLKKIDFDEQREHPDQVTVIETAQRLHFEF